MGPWLIIGIAGFGAYYAAKHRHPAPSKKPPATGGASSTSSGYAKTVEGTGAKLYNPAQVVASIGAPSGYRGGPGDPAHAVPVGLPTGGPSAQTGTAPLPRPPSTSSGASRTGTRALNQTGFGSIAGTQAGLAPGWPNLATQYGGGLSSFPQAAGGGSSGVGGNGGPLGDPLAKSVTM